MSNTIGTIIRAFGIMAWLIAGWFCAVAALYAAVVWIVGLPFSLGHAGILFSIVLLLRMVYPRNVFKG